jgi:hypothetical protein
MQASGFKILKNPLAPDTVTPNDIYETHPSLLTIK